MSEKRAPADLPDTLKNALPPLGGPALEFPKHEYSDAPYKHAVTKTDSEEKP